MNTKAKILQNLHNHEVHSAIKEYQILKITPLKEMTMIVERGK